MNREEQPQTNLMKSNQTLKFDRRTLILFFTYFVGTISSDFFNISNLIDQRVHLRHQLDQTNHTKKIHQNREAQHQQKPVLYLHVAVAHPESQISNHHPAVEALRLNLMSGAIKESERF